MLSLRDTPIKRKLRLVIVLTTSFALLLMAGTVVTYEVVTFRASMQAATSVLAEVVASQSTSALMFNAPDVGRETLNALEAEPQVTAAALYDTKDQLFATYTPEGGDAAAIPLAPEPLGSVFDSASLVMFQPVMENGKRQGTIYVRADLREMYERLLFYAMLVLVAGLGAIAAAAWISSALQQRISGPILDLAATARSISGQQDYSMRATVHGRDEIGELTEAFNQMVTRLGETNTALQQAKETAEGANRAKDEFLAILSHELRTPLTPVLATVSMLQEEAGTSPALLRELHTIQRNVELEARLIDDLLDLTRITRGKLELHVSTLDMRPLLEHAVQSYLITHAARKSFSTSVTVAPNTAMHVLGDAPRLTQVLWNLLQNAVKFTPEGGSVKVHVSNEAAPLDHARAPDLVIEISDTGIGIDAGQVPRIFTAFEQGERARTRVFGGLGLGLAISLAIAERHGGTLTAASRGRGQGATFTLRLPTVAAAVEPPADADAPAAVLPGAATSVTVSTSAAAAHQPESAAARILLVEDHPDTARQIGRLISREGHHVTSAGSVGQALQLAAQQSFDLLVSDLGLPDGSGHDLMRQLANEHSFAGIALSGYGMEEDVRASLAAGFSLHLTKPIHWPELKKAMDELLQGRRGRE
ncbi:MAG: ATP-binding protein [Prosthecobacter sp.]